MAELGQLKSQLLFLARFLGRMLSQKRTDSTSPSLMNASKMPASTVFIWVCCGLDYLKWLVQTSLHVASNSRITSADLIRSCFLIRSGLGQNGREPICTPGHIYSRRTTQPRSPLPLVCARNSFRRNKTDVASDGSSPLCQSL